MNSLEKKVNAQILIVDELSSTRFQTTSALRQLGFPVEEIESADIALARLEVQQFDLLLLNIDLVSQWGSEVMNKACILRPNLTIVVLTNQPTLESIIAAMHAGAADYLVKSIGAGPIASAVAQALQKKAARQEQLHRKLAELIETSAATDSPNPTPPSLTFKQLKLDRASRLVTVDSKPSRTIQLSRGETEVFSPLMARPEMVQSCQQLVSAAWGYRLDHDEAATIIRPYISRLRRKLEPEPARPRIIHTARGLGYFLATK